MNNFLDCKVGDVCICHDEYSHDYEEHKVRIDTIEYDKEYCTDTNPLGMVCYVTDLEYEGDDEYAIGCMHEGNFVCIIKHN